MHPTIAMTAAQAVGAASLLHGSVAMSLGGRWDRARFDV